jgi:hypothetical protein
MWFFKKRKYKFYKVVWQYESTRPEKYAEFVRAFDIADAWDRVRNNHDIPIHCDSVVEVNEDGYSVDRGEIE